MKNISKWFKSLKVCVETDIKKLLIRIVILIFIYACFMIVDRLTKQLIFTKQDFFSNSNHEINWGIIGFRPVLNNGAAFSSLLGWYIFLQVTGIIVTILTISIVFFKIELKFFIPIIFIGAGALGNVLDRFIYDGYVRDILYFPWWPKYATFNLADSFIVVNTFTLLILLIINMISNRTQKESTGKVV